jgi:hypothetical protein
MRNKRVFGLSMESRNNRRRLVVAAYALLALLAIGGWFLDRLNDTGVYAYLAAFFINYYIFGGYGPSGLIKPFSNKSQHNKPIPTSLVELQLAVAGYRSVTDGTDRNDERELQRRDRVHYQAYQAICVLLAVIWILAMWETHPPRFIPARLLPMLLYPVVLPIILLAITLPQAILLWTEPDMDVEADEEAQTAAVQSVH